MAKKRMKKDEETGAGGSGAKRGRRAGVKARIGAKKMSGKMAEKKSTKRAKTTKTKPTAKRGSAIVKPGKGGKGSP